MPKAALKVGGWHAPTQEQKPIHPGWYESTTWDPHRKDGFMPSPIRTFWDGKQWLWTPLGEVCKFQKRSWRGTTNREALPTTMTASKNGNIELVRVVDRDDKNGTLAYCDFDNKRLRYLFPSNKLVKEVRTSKEGEDFIKGRIK